MTDIDAAYADAVRRATDAAYRFAVDLEEQFAPCDAPRTWPAMLRLSLVTAALDEIRLNAGILYPTPRGAQPEEE